MLSCPEYKIVSSTYSYNILLTPHGMLIEIELCQITEEQLNLKYHMSDHYFTQKDTLNNYIYPVKA